MAKIRSKLGLVALALILSGLALVTHIHSARIDALLHESYMASVKEMIAANSMIEEISGIQSAVGHSKTELPDKTKVFKNLDKLLAQAKEATARSRNLAVKYGAPARAQAEDENITELTQLSEQIAQLKSEWDASLMKSMAPDDSAASDLLRARCTQIMALVGTYAEKSQLDMEKETSAAAQLMAESRNFQIGGTWIVISFTFASAFLISRMVVRPLNQMTRTAMIIADGDRDRRFSLKRRDEFGLLASSFDEVLDSLENAASHQTKLQATLADQAQDLEHFFNLSADLLCIMDFDGNFLRVNHAFEIILGYSQRELLARPLFSILHPEDEVDSIRQIEKWRSGEGTSFSSHNRCRHRDGSWHRLSWNAVCVQEHRKIYAAARDLTEEWLHEEAETRRREMMARYQNSSLRLRDASTSSLSGFYRLLTEELTRTLGVSRASIWSLKANASALSCVVMYENGRFSSGHWLQMTDCPEYFSAIRSLKPVIAEDARIHAATQELFGSYLEKHDIAAMLDVPICAGEAVAGVICCEQKGQSRAWTPEDIKYVSDAASLAMIAIEQHQKLMAQEELRQLNATLEEQVDKRSAEIIENERRFRLMISQVKDYAILMLDPDGHIISWNEGAKRTKGYAAEEILGHHYSCFYPPELLSCKLPEQLLETATREGTSTHEGWRIRKDGSRFWAEVLITAIRDADGRLYGFTKVTRDLTEWKAADSALREALKTQQELTQKALAGERAKSEFLAVMSHEVRTPMNAILGFSEMLSQAPELSGQNLDYARTIYRSGSSLLRILDDILDFSSSEAGTLKICSSDFSLHEILTEVSNLLGKVAESRNLALTFLVSPKIPDKLVGDAGRLRQILLNLVGNGLKFAEVGGVTVSVSEDQERGENHWKFSIHDTGPGIPLEYQERIFDPFVQTDASVSRRHGGAGLGLSICKRLTDLMGGTLELISTTESGAEFVVSLPFEVSAPSIPPLDSKGEIRISSTFAEEHPLKILVVEDDPINMQLNLIILGKLGYQPFPAIDGKLAVEAWCSLRPDFILMDVQMPEMDGIEVTRLIRKIEQEEECACPTFIAALTANTQEADRKRLFDAGISAYLNKPTYTSAITEALIQAHAERSQLGHAEASIVYRTE